MKTVEVTLVRVEVTTRSSVSVPVKPVVAVEEADRVSPTVQFVPSERQTRWPFTNRSVEETTARFAVPEA